MKSYLESIIKWNPSKDEEIVFRQAYKERLQVRMNAPKKMSEHVPSPEAEDVDQQHGFYYISDYMHVPVGPRNSIYH